LTSFIGVAGELRFARELLQGDVNGDSEVAVSGVARLAQVDLVL
jgi:hypothetical protein